MKQSRMYPDVKTWNPFLGCEYDCIYCKPSFQKVVASFTRMRGSSCRGCLEYAPHEHPERLEKIPSAETVFVCGNGDISFSRPEYVSEIITRVGKHIERCPRKQFYFQTKDPRCLNQYLDVFPKNNVILLTTLETNRDEGYHEISKAPVPSKRYEAFKDIEWPRKMITIEPIMSFDIEVFLEWVKAVQPECVWIGYNSRPNQVRLNEPSFEKTKLFVQELRRYGITVKEKEMRMVEEDCS